MAEDTNLLEDSEQETNEETQQEEMNEQTNEENVEGNKEPKNEQIEDDQENVEPEETFEAVGELTDSQVASLPDHMKNSDGTVKADEMYKAWQGFREKQSDGSLDEAIEFYEEYGDQADEIQEKLEQEKEESEDDQEETEDADSEVPDSPDDYELKTDEAGIDPENDPEMAEYIKEKAHSANLSEEQLNTFVNEFESDFDAFVPEMDREEELKKISEDTEEAEKFVQQQKQWLDHLNDQGVLNEEEYNELVLLGGTGDGVKALAKLREEFVGTKDVPTEGATQSTQDDMAEIEKMMDDPRYKQWTDEFDPEYRKKVQKKLNKLDNS